MTRMMVRLLIPLSLVCLWLVLLARPVGAMLPLDDEILYSANLNKTSFEIFRMSLTRNISVMLTRSPSNHTNPDWSPDGRHIVYVDDAIGAGTIYIMDAEGQNNHVLITPMDGDQDNPTWSPDGQSIAYIFLQRAVHFQYNPQLILFDLHTQTNRYLTNNIDKALVPYWSPDSKQIAFITGSADQAAYKIVSVTLKNGEVQDLTASHGNELSPVWSPDKRYIAYVGNSPDGIYLSDTTTKESRLLYALQSRGSVNGWSTDGRYLLLTLYATDRTQHLYKLDVPECQQDASSCALTPLFVERKSGSYTAPRWRPLSP